MNSVDETVLSLFEKLITVDPELTGEGQEIVGADMMVRHHRCSFTLASLYRWTKNELVTSYHEFRSQLYQGEINTVLARKGYIIDILESTGHVDSSTYQLRKL